jgi:hypothetical protein
MKDAETLTLEIAELRPTWYMETAVSLRSVGGTSVQGAIPNTIHELADCPAPRWSSAH